VKRSGWALVAAACFVAMRAHATDAETCASAAERAQPLRRAGKLREALRNLRQCAAAECPSVVRGECVSWLGEVEKALPTIVVRAALLGKDQTDVAVSVDGQVVADRLDGRPIALDPGPHEMHYELAGAKPVNARVVLIAGEQNRILVIRFEPIEDKKPEREAPSTPPLVFWLAGIGIGVVGVGTIFYAVGLNQRSELAATCKGHCDPSSVHSAQAKLVIGDVAVGLGIVSLAAAAIVFFTSPRKDHLDVRALSTWK
jgi:hypothetical protein